MKTLGTPESRWKKRNGRVDSQAEETTEKKRRKKTTVQWTAQTCVYIYIWRRGTKTKREKKGEKKTKTAPWTLLEGGGTRSVPGNLKYTVNLWDGMCSCGMFSFLFFFPDLCRVLFRPG